MTPYDPTRHHRRSIRLKGYDYTQPGAYFITICTHERAHVFGAVADGTMRLNDAGRIAAQCWRDIPAHFPHVKLDAFVIMPNHVHGVLWIMDDDDNGDDVGARHAAPLPAAAPPHTEQFGKPVPGSIPTVVRSFKSAATQRINAWRGTPGAPIWQRNYYEHIIRDERALNAIRCYIQENPLRWHLDRENDQRIGSDPLAREIWEMFQDDDRHHATGDAA
ncbi:MAG: transposase [candidate division KSB1 bacterium]|nr:transposase [candidate division KSB1 bacterium]